MPRTRDHVFGYTVINDVSAPCSSTTGSSTSVQPTPSARWARIVTRDELPDWEAIRIQSHVNGELRQDALVGEQLGPRPPQIEWLSSVITLEPGDVLSTGTPAGSRDVRGSAAVPAARRHGHRVGERDRRVEGDRAGHGADSRVTDVR